MTKSEDHLDVLDRLRGIAILIVFLFHAFGATFGTDHLAWNGFFRDFRAAPVFLGLLPLTLGWIGVPIFFVVSGFCIHLSHLKSSSKNFKLFFVRRFFRIYPPYFVALAFFAFLFPFSRVQHDPVQVAQILSHFSLLHNIAGRLVFGINPSFWSIAVEVQLYLLYPFVLLCSRKLGWAKSLMIIGSVEVLLRGTEALLGTSQGRALPSLIVHSPFYFWLSWGMGAYIAEAYLKAQQPKRVCPVWFWPLMVLAAYFYKPLFPFCSLFAALSAANYLAFVLFSPVAQSPIPIQFRRHLSFLGVISYSFYLIHQPLVAVVPRAVRKFFPQYGSNSLLFLSLYVVVYVIIVLIAWSFFRLIERPSIQMGKIAVKSKFLGAPVRQFSGPSIDESQTGGTLTAKEVVPTPGSLTSINT
jgi:peptidoglycan/LPS O-acetylase OafA/YrhL